MDAKGSRVIGRHAIRGSGYTRRRSMMFAAESATPLSHASANPDAKADLYGVQHPNIIGQDCGVDGQLQIKTMPRLCT